MDASPFDTLVFDNRFLELPADPSQQNRPRQVFGACYSRVDPTPVTAPALVAHAAEVAELVGLGGFDPDDAAAESTVAEVLGGNRQVPGMATWAACYGGHQFGHWAGQLGDGRAISLGEVTNDGHRFELQLKGAGPTPYSRTADGRAVLRSSVREFLCSEAMHHLGVPTTRALSLVTTGEQVVRDMFYDGRPEPEPGAVVCRVAPSFLRFGSFEIFASRRETEVLRRLAEWAVDTHFPHLATKGGELDRERIAEWYAEVCRSTAVMIAHWMRVGFVHGVMNTDNMSIHGLTIDYGPYGWLDDYDPDWTPNTTDAQGRRYRFGHQPHIASWNLARFAEALVPLVGEDISSLEAGLELYGEVFGATWRRQTLDKLGLASWREGDGPEGDLQLVRDLFKLLAAVETDMTLFFRRLMEVGPVAGADSDVPTDQDLLALLAPAYYREDDLDGPLRPRLLGWLGRYRRRLDGEDPAARLARMGRANPVFVLRNYLAQQAIDQAAQGDTSGVHELLGALRHPYDEQPPHLTAKRPDWARHAPGCSMLSCSS